MAISLDTSTSHDDDGTGTFSHTCAATATILFAAFRNNGTLSGATYNSVAMTQIQSTVSNTDQYSLWYLVNPASGAHNVVLAGAAISTMYGVAASYIASRANSSVIDVSGTVATVSSSPLSIPLTPTRGNGWMVAFVFDRSGSNFTAATNCTKRQQPSNASSMGWFDSNGAIAAGLNTMTVNEGSSSAGAIQAVFSPPLPSMFAIF
jgi:hypothetical protein